MNNKISDASARENDRDLNRDPITGTPGAHPVGTGVGAAAGGAAGAAAGAVGGPLGMAAGAVIGAVVGGLAGKGVADPSSLFAAIRTCTQLAQRRPRT